MKISQICSIDSSNTVSEPSRKITYEYKKDFSHNLSRTLVIRINIFNQNSHLKRYFYLNKSHINMVIHYIFLSLFKYIGRVMQRKPLSENKRFVSVFLYRCRGMYMISLRSYVYISVSFVMVSL